MQYCYSSMAQEEDEKDYVLAMDLNGLMTWLEAIAMPKSIEKNTMLIITRKHFYTCLSCQSIGLNGAIGYFEQLIDRRRMVWWDVNWTDLILPTGQDLHFHQLPPERTEAPSSGREKKRKKKRGEYEGACWFKNRVALGKHDFYNPSLYKPV